MRFPLALIASVVLIAAVSRASDAPEPPRCKPPQAADLPPPGSYPEHPLSPIESLKNFDVVFYGEVLVPARRCSLGWCAGLRVLRTLKGKPGATSLVQVASLTDAPCGPATFLEKAARWMVFANLGSSPGGQRYLHAGEDGPSFQTIELPDLAKLEGLYRRRRAQLDSVIDDRLGRLR